MIEGFVYFSKVFCIFFCILKLFVFQLFFFLIWNLFEMEDEYNYESSIEEGDIR